jgi:hypothetical protein
MTGFGRSTATLAMTTSSSLSRLTPRRRRQRRRPFRSHRPESELPHIGCGKIRLTDYHDFEDLKSIFALHEDYIIAKPLIHYENGASFILA